MTDQNASTGQKKAELTNTTDCLLWVSLAGAAMNGILASGKASSPESVVETAELYADDLLHKMMKRKSW